MGKNPLWHWTLLVLLFGAVSCSGTAADEKDASLAARHAPLSPAPISRAGEFSVASSRVVLERRLRGEFEPQGAILIGCHEFVREFPTLFATVVSAVGKVQILAMVNDAKEQRLAVETLRQRGIPHNHVRFVRIRHDTMWARDYGPMLLSGPGRRVTVVDARYVHEREHDDNVPLQFADRWKLRVVSTILGLDGGNLISNGAGLCLTTRRLLEDNAQDDIDERTVRDMLVDVYGARHTVILEPLSGEPTGHVDMFATFTSATTVVIGAFDPRVDPENAAILDRNAARLARIRMNGHPLNIVRIPMPSHADGVWRSYTNVVFANGTILVPSYLEENRALDKMAMRTFSSLLPSWTVRGIDVRELSTLGGALHCITMNLGPLSMKRESQLQAVAPKRNHRPIGSQGGQQLNTHKSSSMVFPSKTRRRPRPFLRRVMAQLLHRKN